MTAWLLDTGPLAAFFDRSDADHEWAKGQWAQRGKAAARREKLTER
jgi:hypothetical protein